MNRGVLFGLAALALVATGCTDDKSVDSPAPSPASTQPPPVVAAPAPPAPEQMNQTGLAKVAFDPCSQIEDATVESIGLDPKSRKRVDNIGEIHTSLGCQFNGVDRIVGVTARNVPFDEEKSEKAPNYQPTTVNGREAIVGTNIVNHHGCTSEFQVSFGEIIIDMVNRSTEKMRGLPPCDGIGPIAESIERVLPKGL